MLREGSFEVVVGASVGCEEGWREVDRRLRRIAGQRAALDAEEARWLREAVRLQIWRALGKVSMRAYLEDVLGYGPHAASERLRVAEALAELPAIGRALGAGELPYSAVRELTRVATRGTEGAWLAASRGKNLRQIEELVAGHRPGEVPSDPPDPEVVARAVRFLLRPETIALMRQTSQELEAERGMHLDEDQLLAAAFGEALEARRCRRGDVGGAEEAEPEARDAADAGGNGRAKFQIAITTCAKCKQAWQEGAGVQVAIDAAAHARAECDAQRIGSLEAATPERATQDIPPATRRLVWRRDSGRCRVPGCRSSRCLELHHIIPRAEGGTHEPSRIILLCDGHHAALHRGLLTITGTAPDHLVFRSADKAPHQTNAPVPFPVGRHAPAAEPAPSPVGRHALAAEPAPSTVGRHALAAEPAPSPVGRHAPAAEPAPSPVGRHAPAAEPAPADVGDDQRALTRAELVSALLNLGCTRKEAQAATEVAWQRVPPDASAQALLRGALVCFLPKHGVVNPHRNEDES